MNHKILLVALLMLCACAGIKAANYEPFQDVTTANGIYREGVAVTPGNTQNATMFNEDITTFPQREAENNSDDWDNWDKGQSGTGVKGTPISNGWYILFGLGCLVAALRIKKVLAEE